MDRVRELLEEGTHKSLKTAIESGLIPDYVLHVFACDCAERALIREHQAERNPDYRSWRVIQVKRLWLEGKATEAKLKEAAIAAWNAALSAASGTPWSAASSAWSAASSAWSAASSAAGSAEDAAWSAGSSSARKAEVRWQCKHLLSLHQSYQDSRRGLLEILRQRGKALKVITRVATLEYEGVLYG